MYSARKYLKETDVEFKALKIGAEISDNDIYNKEAGMDSRDYDSRQLMLIGFEAIENEIKMLRAEIVHSLDME